MNYLKNSNLEKQVRVLRAKDLRYSVSCRFLFTPSSIQIKLDLFSYIKNIASETNQSLDINQFERGGGFIQKRKIPRIEIGKGDDISFELDGIKIEKIIDLSLGGIKFITPTPIRYSSKRISKLSFGDFEIYLFIDIRSINPIDVGV